MIKHILVPTTLAFAAASHATCITDSEEIGDVGPSSSKVCESLESQYPDSELAVQDRDILSGETVSVKVSVNGNSQSWNYRLVGPDWVLEAPQIASTQK